MRSKRISLILQDGTPYGVRTVELSNWNGKVIISSRAALKKVKELAESKLPAVYFLLGENNQVYVGETDALSSRLAHHEIQKEFWKDMIAFTSPELGKTEVKYLEHLFAKRLSDDGLVDLQNSTTPKAPAMRPEVKDAMCEYVDNASDVLLALGYDFIGASADIESDASQGQLVFCKGPGAQGNGRWSSNGMLVLSGSLVRKGSTKTIPDSAKRIRQEMINNGVLSKSDIEASYRLNKDHLFSSASAAADVILGRSANGLTEWKTKDGKTIKLLEQE